MKTRDMVMCALLAAVICVLAPVSVPIGPVPISLATFAVMLAGAVLGAKWGTMSSLIYILLGCVGVPVFAGWTGGIDKVAGSTGGYIVGYLPLAFCTGLFVDLFAKKAGKVMLYVWLTVGMVIGNVILYVLGTAWFIQVSGATFSDALAWCVTPFLGGNFIKMAAVLIIAPQIRKALLRAGIEVGAKATA